MERTSMAYNPEFYKMYADYLIEPRVRAEHDEVLALVTRNPAFQHVIDFGCGQSNEFFHYGKPEFYVGIDANAVPIDEANRKVVAADYRDIRLIKNLVEKYDLRAAVSLFSAEGTASHLNNVNFYESVFAETGLEAILVSGFEYEHAKGKKTVQEFGSLVSFQSFVARLPSEIYYEAVVTRPSPSNLFGEDIVNRWYLLQNKKLGEMRPDPTRPTYGISRGPIGHAELAALFPKLARA
jgi:hypothetical protein